MLVAAPRSQFARPRCPGMPWEVVAGSPEKSRRGGSGGNPRGRLLCALPGRLVILRVLRDVAQSGSAPEWGSGGRRFESGRPDSYGLWVSGGTDFKSVVDTTLLRIGKERPHAAAPECSPRLSSSLFLGSPALSLRGRNPPQLPQARGWSRRPRFPLRSASATYAPSARGRGGSNCWGTNAYGQLGDGDTADGRHRTGPPCPGD